MPFLRALCLAVLALSPACALEGKETFTTGPVIEDFGPVASVPGAAALPADATFKVSYDVREKAAAGELNRTLVTAARFLNMHARAGVAPENMKLAVVVHGGAVRDVTHNDAYKTAENGDNANLALIEALIAHGVEIYVCGQSAAHYNVAATDLAPGVTMAISAMTMHALLQQDGYTLNPF